jgi:cytochrome P450
MAECTKDMLDRWDSERSDDCGDIHREMMRLTFRIVGRTLLSAEVDGDAKAIGDALDVAIKWANDHLEHPVRLPPWFPTPNNLRFARAKRTIEELVLRIVAERRQKKEPKNDLLGMLMDARDEEGRGMSDAQLLHELVTLVLAGHETTANALTFILYLLSKHPAVLRKLEREVSEVLGARPPTLADLPRLAYTSQTIEESMRLYPPAWVIERESIEDDVVCGYRIPKGSIVGLPPWVTHRLPRLWPNPEGFDPDRFSKDSTQARHKHAYLPFGSGPRTCIGNAFAMMEMQIVLPMIVQRYRLELAPGFELVLDPSITLRPKEAVPMKKRRVDRLLA